MMLDTSKMPNNVLEYIANNLGREDNEPIQMYLSQIEAMTPKEAFDRYLIWNGIIGYSEDIWNAVECLKLAEGERIN